MTRPEFTIAQHALAALAAHPPAVSLAPEQPTTGEHEPDPVPLAERALWRIEAIAGRMVAVSAFSRALRCVLAMLVPDLAQRMALHGLVGATCDYARLFEASDGGLDHLDAMNVARTIAALERAAARDPQGLGPAFLEAVSSDDWTALYTLAEYVDQRHGITRAEAPYPRELKAFLVAIERELEAVEAEHGERS